MKLSFHEIAHEILDWKCKSNQLMLSTVITGFEELLFSFQIVWSKSLQRDSSWMGK